MSYSDFGLDERKLSQDPDSAEKRLPYCPFSERALVRGYSLCFMNWGISLEVAQAFLQQEPMAAEPGDMCIKCQRRDATHLYYNTTASVGICRDCCQSAVAYLTKPPPPPPPPTPGTQFRLF